jgi:hypothetical protein
MIQLLKILNQLAKHLIKNLRGLAMVAARIPKPDSRLSSVSGSSIKASNRLHRAMLNGQSQKRGRPGHPSSPASSMAAGDLSGDRDLNLAADRLGPAGRPDLRPVRHVVRGGGYHRPGSF